LTHEDIMKRWHTKHAARAAILAAEDASRLMCVRQFREAYLPDGLLEPADQAITDWVRERLQESMIGGGIAAAVGTTTNAKLRIELSNGRGWPSDPQTRLSGYDVGCWGELCWLANVWLPDLYGWTPESSARWLIVKESTPHLKPIRPELVISRASAIYAAGGETREEFNQGIDGAKDKERPLPYLAFRFEVPIDFPASRLKAEFEAMQRGFADRFRFDVPGGKPTAGVQVTQAVYAAERNDGRTWRDLAESWNTDHPEERVDMDPDSVKRFAGYVRRAYRSLMGETISWRGTRRDESGSDEPDLRKADEGKS
jgi:hypothetical protein